MLELEMSQEIELIFCEFLLFLQYFVMLDLLNLKKRKFLQPKLDARRTGGVLKPGQSKVKPGQSKVNLTTCSLSIELH